MFEKRKERIRQQQEERARQIRKEKESLMALSEKELLIEILYALKHLDERLYYELEDVKSTVRLYGN